MKSNYFLASLAAFILTLSGCAATQASNNEVDEQWGYTKATSIEVCKPRGQREYLSRLICSDGQHPTFYRVGNFGMRTPLTIPENLTPQERKQFIASLPDCGAPIKPGETDYHIVDGYKVTCSDKTVMIYMDMYHCNQPVPTHAPQGFSIQPQ